MASEQERRAFLVMAGAGVLLGACSHAGAAGPARSGMGIGATSIQGPEPRALDSGDVSAVEDLMREHGVIRRLLVVYREAANRLRGQAAGRPANAAASASGSPANAPPANAPPAHPPPANALAASTLARSLADAAALMRQFAEDYHERLLEEQHVFPVLARETGSLANVVALLLEQHRRGRAITDYVTVNTRDRPAVQDAEGVARALDAYARMVEMHTAMEDTLVFPAWKKAIGPRELDAAGDRFEAIEHATFGHDGFDEAVARVGAIEQALGVDLAMITAPLPSASSLASARAR